MKAICVDSVGLFSFILANYKTFSNTKLKILMMAQKLALQAIENVIFVRKTSKCFNFQLLSCLQVPIPRI